MPDVIESVQGRETEVSAAEADAMIEIFEGRPGLTVQHRWESVQYIVSVYREGEWAACVSYLIRF